MNNIEFLKENPEIASQVTISLTGKDLISFLETLEKTIQKPQPNQNELASAEDRLITIEEAAEIFGVSRVTLWQWGKKGILNPVKIGHIVRYKISDIKNVLASLRPQYSTRTPQKIQP